jgi:U2 small nuclear ribonucleoprotein A'
VLGNFPLSPRIQTLILTRNRITSIQPTLYRSIPNLTSAVFTHNRLAELADLEPLSRFSKLTYLVLNDNPVKSKENYRSWVIWRCPKVRFLDYQKVKDVEREQANELFGTIEEPSALAAKILSIKSKATFEAAPAANGASGGEIRVKLTPKERKRVEELIRNAKSLKEIDEFEKMLTEGKVPGGILDDAMET